MSNKAPKEWVKDKRQREQEKERNDKPACLHCGAPATYGSAFCDACD